jgi:hypothetical protein
MGQRHEHLAPPPLALSDAILHDGVWAAYLIQGEPVRDAERLIWTVDLRPA